MDTVDCLVIGAGVVGLAVARALALAGREVVVAERHERFGMEISSRNSEVIHAGIHYPVGSLKARLCVDGRERLYDYCRMRRIVHRRCGKLIVATQEVQRSELERIGRTATSNGVTDLRLLDRDEVLAFEPELRVAAALLSPSTGIVDTHQLMLSLLADAEVQGVKLALRSPVGAMRVEADGIVIHLGDEPSPVLKARWVINCAGLLAGEVAHRIDGFPKEHVPRLHYAKGSYFALRGRAPCSRLVYPMPEPGGLGIHLTLDIAGNARFGPDVEWVDTLDYRVDAQRAEGFYRAIRAYWPQLRDGDLSPAYAGIRPKLSGPGEPNVDFRIDGPRDHGVPGIVNLFGIESPGLTASLAIAEHVAAMLVSA